MTPLTNSCASSTFADGTLLNVTLDGNTFDGEAPLTGLFPGGNVATDEWFTIVTRPSSTEVGLPEDCSPEDRFTFSSNFGSYGDLTNCSRTFGGTNEPLDSALNNDSGGQSASGICSKAMNVY